MCPYGLNQLWGHIALSTPKFIESVRMTNVFELVTEFHEVNGVEIRTTPTVDVPEADLRIEMLKSEMAELFEAALTLNEVEIADALADIVYIIEGGALVFGLGPVEVVKYDHKTGEGSMALYLTHSFIIFEEAVRLLDVEYVRVLLSIMKSACYFLAEKAGYPLDEIIEAVHKSNLTKLGEDGKPVYVLEGPEKGKITKGPNYVKPTADIEAILNRRETIGAKA